MKKVCIKGVFPSQKCMAYQQNMAKCLIGVVTRGGTCTYLENGGPHKWRIMMRFYPFVFAESVTEASKGTSDAGVNVALGYVHTAGHLIGKFLIRLPVEELHYLWR